MKKFRLKIPRHKLSDVLNKNFLTPAPNSGEYVLYYFKDKTGEFIIYENTKNKPYVALYSAPTLPLFLNPYLDEELTKEVAKETRTHDLITETTQIGSDEVGFGDFFGPLVVVAAYVDETIRLIIKPYNIQDSKKISDAEILIIGHALTPRVPHTKNIVNNNKYNELIKSGYNMNKIKAMLHHNVLLKLSRQTKYRGPLYIDGFTDLKNYQMYTKDMEKIDIVLVEKGESKVIAIALASIFARYYFLLEMAKLNRQFNTTIPLGAGSNVDRFAHDFLEKNGPSNLKAITKHNFRNFKDLFEV